MNNITFDHNENAWLVTGKTKQRRFCLGTVIKPGDELFEAANADEFVEHVSVLQKKRGASDVNVRKSIAGVHVDGILQQDGVRIPFGAYIPYPEFGNGVRVAQTMDDAKAMAEEFADLTV